MSASDLDEDEMVAGFAKIFALLDAPCEVEDIVEARLIAKSWEMDS